MKFQFINYNILLFAAIIFSGVCFAQLPTDSTKADSLLLKQIEGQMQGTDQPPTQPPRSNATFNPDIGVIGDFQSFYTSRGERNIEFYLNETEVSFQAAVDPYIRGDFFISFGRDEEGKYGVEV